MDHQRVTRHAPPLAYHFVEQAGFKIDESTRSGIRSHAMKEVRNRQRQQKQVETVHSGQQSFTEKGISLCRCLAVAQFSSVSSRQNLETRRVDTSPRSTADHCCNREQLFALSLSQHRDGLQQLSSSMATFATADFNPFHSIPDLPVSLTLKFSNEINVIKSHG